MKSSVDQRMIDVNDHDTSRGRHARDMARKVEGPGMTGRLQTTSPRTLLESLIRDRRQTFEEFAAYAEQFAREHGEVGTLSVRHLQRLVAGRQSHGRPIGQPRPATARLLERIFGITIAELLDAPSSGGQTDAPEALRVAVAIVVKGGEVLMVRRRSDAAEDLTWQFPAGLVKPGNRVEVVATGETLAETAVHCMPVRRLGSRVHPITRVVCEYVLCEYIAGEAINSDVAENAGVLWVSKQDVTRLVSADHVYPPVLEALSATGNRAGSATIAP